MQLNQNNSNNNNQYTTYTLIEYLSQLVNYAYLSKLVDSDDIGYIYNYYIDLFKLSGSNHDLNTVMLHCTQNNDYNIDLLLTKIYDIAQVTIPQSILSNIGDTYDQFSTKLMNAFVPLPSVVISKFKQDVTSRGIKYGLDQFYNHSIAVNYIKSHAISKNRTWCHKSDYGIIKLTINLSKPEKDPKQIALLKSKPANAGCLNQYPKCLLCIENVGFSGEGGLPARHNHRLIPFALNKSKWYLQFSPYAYYNQHAILVSHHHTDMLISKDTFVEMFDFVDQIPHYFIGTNSDIPIVGGSILNHNHYQCGFDKFPIDEATILDTLRLPEYEDTIIQVLNWPLTTLCLIGGRNSLTKLAIELMKRWYMYENPDLGVSPSSIDSNGNKIRHNAIIPIIRKLNQEQYQLYIILRNNQTTFDYPDGVFHVHADKHNIKKENIGLIEAMGLAILPGRLEYELNELSSVVQSYVKSNSLDKIIKILEENPKLLPHKSFVMDVIKHKLTLDANTLELMYKEVASIFLAGLSDCGIHKNLNQLNSLVKDILKSRLFTD